MADALSVDELVGAILAADAGDAWQRSVDELGPQLLGNLALVSDFHARIQQLEACGELQAAATIKRWNDDVMVRSEEDRLKQLLIGATSDDELDRLLEEHRDIISPALVESALGEVQHLMSAQSPMPLPLAATIAEGILHVNVKVASFLAEDDLLARCLKERSRIRYVHDDYAAAISDLETAAQLFRKSGDLFEAGRSISLTGNMLLAQGRPDEAIERLQEAAAVLANVGSDELLGPTYEDIAMILEERGDSDGALPYFDKAAAHRVAAGQIERALPLLSLVVSSYLARRDTVAAYRPAERLIRIGEEQAKAPVAIAIDPDVVDLIRSAALETVADALPESEFLAPSGPAGSESGVAAIGGYRAYVDHNMLEDGRRWLELAQRAHAFAPTEEAAARLALGRAHLASANYEFDQAVEQATRSLEYFEGREERGAMSALVALAEADASRGRLAAASAWCDRALTGLGDGADKEKRRAIWLTVQAKYLLGLGEPQHALQCLQEALRLSKADGSRIARMNEGATSTQLGEVYAYLGDLEGALGAYVEGGRVATEFGHRRGEAVTLQAVGILLGQALEGRFGTLAPERLLPILAQVPGAFAAPIATLEDALADAGRRLLERAADIYREIGYDAGWCEATLNLSNFLPAEQAERRAELLTDVVRRKEALGDRLGEAVSLANLAAAYRALGRPDDARAALLRSLEISRAAGFFESASASSFALGRLYEADGDPAAAEAAFVEAVEMIESARPNVPLADKFRVGFIRSRGGGGAYDRLVDLLVARGAYDQAFDIVQRSKSRALLEVLATTAFEPTAPRTGTFAQLLAEESGCLERLQVAELRASTGDAGGDPLDEVRQLGAIYDEMDQFDPEYVSLRRGTPASLMELGNWLQAQERPVLLVEYFLTDERLTLFFLRADWDSVQVHVEPFTLSEAWNGFRQFQREVVQYQNAGGASWTMMSRMLTEPLAQHLQPSDLIYLVPHRVLHGLPLHALPLDDEPLATLHPVAYTPTAGLLPLAQNVEKGTGKLDRCAAFGVVFEQEAREVAAVFGTDRIEAADLMSEDIPELCRNADVCHFSCHGYFNAVDPLSSGLLLRHDPSRRPEPTDILTARDVMRMRLRSELISLSACKTALSEVSQGDELLGLIRAFLYAGSSSIVASLWSVDADTTRRLMVSFYRNLRDQYAKSGAIDKAAALQAAETEMIESVGSRWSFLWSPFILVGDWH